MATLDFDLYRGASHESMIDNLTGPFGAGAVETPVAIDATGAVTVSFATREPLLVAAPRATLEQTALLLAATLPDASKVELSFEPYTERGSFLPVYRPAVDTAGQAVPFTVSFTLDEVSALGSKTPVPVAGIAGRIELRLIEGVLGRLIYILGHEKQRLRRVGRQVAAMRLLSRARDNALDRTGADLGVPRFEDTLAFSQGEVVTNVRREPDDEYRRRLGIYKPFQVPNARRLLTLLNGPAGPPSANAGPLSEFGFTPRFMLVERDNDFAIAIQLVAVDDAVFRQNFLEFTRRVHLIWPRDDMESRAVHAARFLAEEQIQRETGLRQSLRSLFSFTSTTPNPALAPALGEALVRAGKCRKALKETTEWPILRTQRADAGSRYELGLGADLSPLAAVELNRMGQEHATRTPPATPDPEVEALLQAMTPKSAADDPEGRWLLEPCGLKTVHRVDSNTIYVSHLPIFGLSITGPTEVSTPGWTRILAVNLVSSPPSDLLFYERTTGTAELYATNGTGAISLLRTQGTPSTQYAQIVSMHLGTGAERTVVLFYDRTVGAGAFFRARRDGTLDLLVTHPNWRTSWSEIVPGRFSAGPGPELLFYDRLAGEAEIYSVNQQGNIRLVKAHRGLRKTWTHIVPGNFALGPRTDLLFYDRSSGTGHFYTVDAEGNLALISRRTGWTRTWTHIVPGDFDGSGRTGLLFYERSSGTGEFYAIDGSGNLQLLRRHTGWRKTWTQIVPGQFGAGDTTDLLFYERMSGEAAFYSTDGQGGITLLASHAGWRKSAAQTYEARYHAPGDPGSNVVLATGLQTADAAWRAAPHTGPAWTVLTDQQALTVWQQAAGHQPAVAGLNAFRAAGLPAIVAPATIVEQLKRLPPELVETIRLDSAQASAILAGQVTAANKLRDLADILRTNGIASVLPLVPAAGEVVLVVATIGLPGAGLNLADRRSAGFRWYVVPIQGAGGDIGAVGARTLFSPAEAGLLAIVVVGYRRGAATDPYEYGVELPPSALLNLTQYEFLMNVLEHTHPLGVEVNTFAIRRQHVDLDEDGKPDPLTPSISRTFRPFRRRRHRGQTSVTIRNDVQRE